MDAMLPHPGLLEDQRRVSERNPVLVLQGLFLDLTIIDIGVVCTVQVSDDKPAILVSDTRVL